MSDNRRQGQGRVEFHAGIELTVGEATHRFDETGDLSLKGIFVSTAAPLPVGTSGRFVMTLRAGMRREYIKGDFSVVRVVGIDDGLSEGKGKAGMALKLTHLDDDESAPLLYRVVAYNQPPE